MQTIDLTVATAGVMFNAATGEFSVEHQYLDDNPTGDSFNDYTIGVKVTDDDTGQGMAETTVRVTNVAPMLVEVTAGDINENGVTTLSGKIVDPGSLDTFTLTVNWEDGTVEEYTTLPGGSGIDLLNPPEGVTYDPVTREFTIEHRYLDDNPTGTPNDEYTIRLTLVDDDADVAVDATTITVTNVAPMISELSATGINENGVTVLTGVIIDPGSLDTHTLTINWGDDAVAEQRFRTIDLTVATPGVMLQRRDAVSSRSSTSTWTTTRPAPASDSYTISVTVTDDDTGEGMAETPGVGDERRPGDP